MYELRDYQKKASDAAVSFFLNKIKRNNAIEVLPTGSGKSLIIADIAYKLDAPVLIFQPSKEILEQNYSKMLSYGVLGVSIYSASAGHKNISKITFATIGSAVNHPELFTKFEFIIIDECHFVNAQQGMYKEFIENLKCKVLGLTATPYRLYSNQFYGCMLRFLTRTRPRIFSEVIYHVQINELLQRGYLADIEYYRMRIIDPSNLKINSTGADYTDRSVREAYAKAHFAQSLSGIVERLLAAGRTSILVFTRFIEEAEYLARIMPGTTAVVSSHTDKKTRERILRQFKSKKIDVVANVGILTTGFDYPELDTIVIARPTMSLALWYQMVGREIRPSDGKRAWLIDLCGTYERFGPVDKLIMQQTNGIWAIYSGSKQLTNVFYNKR